MPEDSDEEAQATEHLVRVRTGGGQ